MQRAPGSVELLARIKPYNPKRGLLKQKYYTFFGFNFSEAKGWCRIPSKIVHGGKSFDVEAYLRAVRNNEDDPDSKLVFDVCTIKQAREIDAKETREKEQRANADKADRLGGIDRPVDMRGAGHPDENKDEEEAPVKAEPRRRRARAVASAE
jgi:hypothetical protein